MRDITPGRVFGPGRSVALVVIVVLAVGLGYLRFAPEPTVQLPDDAQAGDLTLEPCDYNGQDAECGTIVVPENRADPDSGLIVLPVTRIRASNGASSEPIFRLEGGPGVPNEFDDPTHGGRLNETRDVVLVGYRGVEGSSGLACPEVAEALTASRDFLGEASLERYAEAQASCADRLSEGVDLDGYTLVQRVEDMETVRIALGYDRINLLSESAGTRTALIYGWRHPESIHRSVMLGVNPPGHYLWYSTTSDDQFGDYTELCSQDQACSNRTSDLEATMRSLSADMPERWLFLRIDDANVKMASRFGLMETTSEMAPLNAPTVLDSWLSAAEGDPSGMWLMSVAFNVLFPEKAWGEQAATGHIDAPYAEEYYASGADVGTILGSAGTDFLWAGGGLVEAWPDAPDNDQYQQVQRSDVETLLISGQLDFSTPPVSATEKLLPYLSNGQQVILDGFGHTVDFWTYQPEAGGRLIQVFYDTGEVDDSLFVDQPVDFTPQTTFTGLAKMLLAILIGLALVALVVFLWMPRHVKRKASFGLVAGAIFRVLVVPLVVGLGGWILAVLGAFALTESVPIDNQLLVVVSIGLPIGFGMYWAWVDRDSPDDLQRLGLWGALLGGVAGAWLGFKAGSQLLAPVTAIVGAAILANLFLIVRDISWERRAAQLRDSAPVRELASQRSS